MSKVDIEKTIYKNGIGKYYANLVCISYVDNQGLQKLTNIFGLKIGCPAKIQYFNAVETKCFKNIEKLEKHILKILKKAKDYVDSQLVVTLSKENIPL